MRFPPMVKVFTNTVPFGKSKSPSVALTVMFLPSGKATQRSFVAPSLHSATFTPYGTRPDAGFFTSAGSVHPVFER